MKKDAKIYIAGHRGLVGSAIYQSLKAKGYTNLITRMRSELDLMDRLKVKEFFDTQHPEYVILAAAHVGGILANNTFRADFIYNNLQIQQNVIGESFSHNVKKLLFLGSTCIYPRCAPQPMSENALLSSELEYTNEPYAIAKIAGLKMCESFNLQYGTNYIAVMPTNLYGKNDNFHLENSHVLPAIMRKIHLANLLYNNDIISIKKDLQARPIKGNSHQSSTQEITNSLANYGISSKSVTLWGSGTPLREFLWSEDLADACVYIMKNINFTDLYDKNSKEIRNCHINIGTGKELSIKELAHLIKEEISYPGQIIFDNTKPDGTMRKLTNVDKLHSLGWHHKTEISQGIKLMYQWYLQGLEIAHTLPRDIT